MVTALSVRLVPDRSNEARCWTYPARDKRFFSLGPRLEGFRRFDLVPVVFRKEYFAPDRLSVALRSESVPESL